MKRGADDRLWQDVKAKVRTRDKNRDRLAITLSMKDYLILKKNAGSLINRLDPAHILSVGSRPDLCYVPWNVVLLNRYSHECLDSFRHPVTGKAITKEEAMEWWKRIAGEAQWAQLQSIANSREEGDIL